MSLTLITPPATEPITVDEAKLAATAEGTAYDAQFSGIWIPSAREQAEHRTGRALITQTWKLTLESFPALAIILPRPPLQSVTHIKYVDVNGNLQTLDAADYQVVTEALKGYVQPAYGKQWPACRPGPGAVQVTFVAGYGAASAVPRSIKVWMQMAVSTWYQQREGIVTGTIVNQLPRDFFAALLDAYRTDEFI